MTLLVLFKTEQLAAAESGGGSVIVPQEKPRHPSMAWSVEILLNVAAPPQIQQRTVGQEQPTGIPAYPAPLTFAGQTASPPLTPEERAVVVGQEIPGHPLPKTADGDQQHFNVAAPPQIQQRIVGQEQPPPLPVPQVAAGIQGPNVASPPQIQQRTVSQEQPYHPPPQTRDGDQTHPNVASPPQIQERSVVGQEQPPPLPTPALVAGLQKDKPQVLSAVVGQEQPTGIPAHPAPVTLDGVATHTNVAAPPQIRSTTLVAQEQPYHPGPQSWPGTPPTPVISLPERRREALVGQEMPGHPPPKTADGVQTHQNVASPPQIQRLQVAQEPPWHPGPLTSAGNPPTSLIERRDVRVTQEPPWHPDARFTQLGVPPTKIVERRDATTRQEMPWHPDPRYTLDGVETHQNVALGIGRIIAVQEQPWHPPPQSWLGVHPFALFTFAPPTRRDAEITQEQPWHPPPFGWPGNPPVAGILPPGILPWVDQFRPRRLLATPGRVRTLRAPGRGG